MKDSELKIDRNCHVLYSRPCKKQIQAKIALHYPETQREAVWERVQRQYEAFLSDWRTNLGGRKNYHNGVGGTYDCIAIMSYYTVCRDMPVFCGTGRCSMRRSHLTSLFMHGSWRPAATSTRRNITWIVFVLAILLNVPKWCSSRWRTASWMSCGKD